MNIRRRRILLVDDQEEVLQSLAEGLSGPDEGFEILTAENGGKALEIFRAGHKIDLLVTDLEMPEMNGFELLANVKKDFPATAAIVLTGLLTPEIKERLKAIGDYVCIGKPVGPGKLRQRIIDELRRHSAESMPPGQNEK
ncbi:MAG: response regulator [Nitrospiraceae bacterium]|nr:response regulator [Nitrospiraceae bacterium]